MAKQTIDDIIRQMQELQALVESQMAGSLPKVFSTLSDDVISISNKLKLNPKNRAESMLEIIRLKKAIADTIVDNPLYKSEVTKVINSFKKLGSLTDEYMGLVIDNYIPRKELYESLLSANSQITKDALLGAGIRDNFSNAIQQVLKANLTGKSSREQLNNTLKKFITGTPEEKPFLERYIKQTTNDSVMVFNREYMQSISDDLGLRHYYYAGTLIEDSRPFCNARAGRYFTKEEVDSWASKDWDGKMKGTNSSTIYTYAGGYNCRHSIYPVSELTYNDKANRQGLK
jgi:hypothetical protein